MEKDWVVLKIDEKRMWASLTIKMPEGDEHPYFSPDFIENYIRGNGIKTGILRDNIEALANSVPYGEEVIVAKGKEPVKGRDGFYSYMVPLEDYKNKPTINHDGSVDYYNSLKLAMIEADQVFAVYSPPTGGEYGYTIFSEMLPPVKGKELRPLRGSGFYTDESRRTYKAKFGGRIFRQGERIVIEKVYVVKGDLDIEQGNIRFNGDVEIKGDVRSGLVIHTDGDIFIHGHVGGCSLAAGGSITIQRGVQGKDRCTITAGRDVACSFIERCRIKAEGNVYADSILDSEIIAKGKVIVSSKRGLILGGSVLGVQGVYAKTIGNEAGISTCITAGNIQEDIEELARMEERITRLKSDIQIFEKNQRVIDTMDGSRITREIETMRVKIIRAKVMLISDLKKIQQEYIILEDNMSRAKKEARICITGILYGNIRICIGRAWLVTTEAIKDIVFKNINNQIISLPGSEEKCTI